MIEFGEIPEDRQKALERATDEFHLFAARMREVYGLDAVVILACKDVGDYVEKVSARSGSLYASRHMARVYSNDQFGDVCESNA